MLTKTIFALSAAILLAGSSAALAAKAKSPDRKAARAAFASVSVAGSSAVFADGKIIGRDPDVNVRLQLMRDYGSWSR